MSLYMGCWKLDIPLYCTKELSGYKYKGTIYGKQIVFCFPSLPENYNDKKLVPPIELTQAQLPMDWGEVYLEKEGIFCVRAMLFVTQTKYGDAIMQRIYEDFPRWRKRFNNLIMIATGNFGYVDTKKSMLLCQEIDAYDKLKMYELIPDEKLRLVDNPYDKQDIQIQMFNSFDLEKMQKLFDRTNSYYEIPLSYELLISAYNSASHEDLRIAVVIAITAVETAILSIIEDYYFCEGSDLFEEDKNQYHTLEMKFEWLNKVGVEISLTDCKRETIELSKNIMYEEFQYDEVMEYLDKCKIIIKEINDYVF